MSSRKRTKIQSGWGTGKLNTQQALNALGISRDTLHKWIKDGTITPIPGMFNPHLKVKPANFFSEEDVKALMGPEQLAALEQELTAQKPEYVQHPLSTSDRASAA